MSRLILWAFSAAVLCWPAMAEASNCAKINNDLDRLACYDKESGRTPVSEEVDVDGGNWRVQVETSKLTDQKDVFMQLLSNEPVDCGWNDNKRISLLLYCQDNTTSFVLNTGCHMTSSKYNTYGDVDFRIDRQKARTLSMKESTDNKALGLWRGSQSIPVIKSMLGKSQVVVRATPYGKNSFTATFNIAGLADAIAPLRKACSW